ncbi:MAG TPA: NAD(P)-dependent alcohol dehydrogenase [Pyrinomonadaceae bacterium]|nr:NAD(P)-dependent alcohol dehydrogenase [Pyrinomonadaceae bacterium]
MKAAIYKDYGPPDVVRIADVDKPVPKDNEVLIKVRAAAINPLDWRLMKGEPRIVRGMARLMKMPIGRPGVDVAGEVEAIGSKVTKFKLDDAVFGACKAAIAEYACADESKIAAKPAAMKFEEAAGINVAGLTALQGLRDRAKVQPGQRVLVNGAAGGVGTFAVQIAKSYGAQVAAVCSTRNLEMVKSIGADKVIDYTWHDFTKNDERYNVIFDCIGNHQFSECKRVLNPGGKFLMVGAAHDVSLAELIATPIKALSSSLFSSQKAVPYIGKASQRDLIFLAELFQAGKLKPVIDKCYPLSDAAAAIHHVEQGHARGKVVVLI